jgi:hypothetical protein
MTTVLKSTKTDPALPSDDGRRAPTMPKGQGVIISDKCIFYNPKTTKCHYISECSKMSTDLCGSKERHEFGKDDREKQELLK